MNEEETGEKSRGNRGEKAQEKSTHEFSHTLRNFAGCAKSFWYSIFPISQALRKFRMPCEIG